MSTPVSLDQVEQLLRELIAALTLPGDLPERDQYRLAFTRSHVIAGGLTEHLTRIGQVPAGTLLGTSIEFLAELASGDQDAYLLAELDRLGEDR